MDMKLQKILTECIRDIETGAADVDGCLERHPEWVAELRPHLDFFRELDATPRAVPSMVGEQRGHRELLMALAADREQGRRVIPFLSPAVARAAAVLAGVALLTAGAAGASAALGGPDLADEVLSTIGVASHNDGPVDNGLENARDHAADEADFGLGTAEIAIDHGLNIAREHASDKAQKGLDTAEKATDDGLNVAEEHASDKAQRGLDTARDAKDKSEDVPSGPPEAPGRPGAP